MSAAPSGKAKVVDIVDPKPVITLLSDYADEIEAQGKVPTLDWGLPGLNAKAGLPVSAMASLTGPTGGFKTSLAMFIASHHCRPGGAGLTVWLKAELTGAQLAAKRVAQVTGHSWGQVLAGTTTTQQNRAALDGFSFYVVNVGRRDKVIELARRALDEVAKRCAGTPLLVLDYLQRVRGEGRDVREATTNLVDDFVDLVESRPLYGLLLSKGSRSSSNAMRDGKTRGERLVDAGAETNAIEHGSTVQLAVTFENREGETNVDARLEITKNRYGATGAALGVRFHGPTGRVTELEGLPRSKADQKVRDAVAKHLASHPGAESRTHIYNAVGGTKATVLRVIADMLEDGEIGIQGSKLYLRGVP